MDAELKSFLLEILKNQARIFNSIERIQSTLEPDLSPEINKEINEIYEKISETSFTLYQSETKLIEAQIIGGHFN